MKTSLIFSLLSIFSCKTVSSKSLTESPSRTTSFSLPLIEPGVSPLLFFADGSYLQVSEFWISDKNMSLEKFRIYSGQEINFEASKEEGLIMRAQSSELNRVFAVLHPVEEQDTPTMFEQFRKMASTHYEGGSSKDMLVVRSGGVSLDSLAGILSHISSSSIAFEGDGMGKPLLIENGKLKKVYALLLSALGKTIDSSMSSETKCYVQTATSFLKGSKLESEETFSYLSRAGMGRIQFARKKIIDSGCETPGELDITKIVPKVVSIKCDGKFLSPSSLSYSSCTPVVSKAENYVQFFPESVLIFDLEKKYQTFDFSYEANLTSATPLVIVVKDADQKKVVYKKEISRLSPEGHRGGDTFRFDGSRLQFEIYGNSADSLILKKPLVRE